MWSRVCVVLAITPLLVRPLDAHNEGPWARGSSFTEHIDPHGSAQGAHRHAAQAGAPCDACPGRAPCVPRVQCPALLRAPPPLCHLPAGQVGVCCTTGHSHASASDRRQRAASSPGADALRAAHRRSQQRAEDWSERERRLAAAGADVPRSSPSYGHHLSTKTGDVERANALGRGALRNLFATEELRQRQLIADDQLRLALPITTDSPFCPAAPECPPRAARHRRADGACGSATNPAWGAAHTAYERVLPPDYGDGTWSLRVSAAGGPLPGARAVSQAALPDAEHASATHSALLALFGQFLAHDVTASVPFTLGTWSLRVSAAGGPLPGARAVTQAALPDAEHASATHSALLTLFGQFLTHDVTASVPFTLGTWSLRVSAAGGPLPGARAVSQAALPDAENASATHSALLTLFGQFLTHDVTASVPFTLGTWSLRVSAAGGPLPGARAVSQAALPDAENASATHSALLALFGQFLAHDVTASVPFTLVNGTAISCCAPDGSLPPPELQHPACAAVPLPPADPFYSRYRQRCMSFVRAQLAPAHDCELGYARQMNGVTHYADLSPIYGSSDDKMAALREADTGRLAVFSDFGRDLPPLSAAPDECLQQHEGAACFASGDDHVNQMISLVALHTLWIREHNRLAEALASLNPSWSPETVFLEARRLLIAEYQHILYNEWLPSVIGPQHMEVFKLSPRPAGEYSADYGADVNPSVTSEVAAAALRFGHSVVGAKLTIPGPEDVHEEVAIPEVMFQPSRMRLRHFLDRLLVGLSWQPMQTADPFVTEALTRYMFHAGQPFGLDLAAINVQRGRDHGLPSYNHYRRLAGAEPYTRFSQFSAKAAERLSSVYATPDDLDLWVGGLLEPPLPDAAVGATFGDLLADQFSRMRRGDRHFYEHGPDVNPGAFTAEQLAEVKKVSMARVVCDNSDGVDLRAHAPRAFLLPTLPGNEPLPCDSSHIPRMDLSKFREL